MLFQCKCCKITGTHLIKEWAYESIENGKKIKINGLSLIYCVACGHETIPDYMEKENEKIINEGRLKMQEKNDFTFSEALVLLKNGIKVSRRSWDQSSFVYRVPSSQFEVNRPPLLGIYPEGTPISYRDHLDMRLTDGTITVWTPTQPDIFGEDWFRILD